MVTKAVATLNMLKGPKIAVKRDPEARIAGYIASPRCQCECRK